MPLALAREVVTLRFASVDDAVGFYATRFGPVVLARAALEPRGEWPALRDALAAVFARHSTAGNGGVAFPAEYLVAMGRR